MSSPVRRHGTTPASPSRPFGVQGAETVDRVTVPGEQPSYQAVRRVEASSCSLDWTIPVPQQPGSLVVPETCWPLNNLKCGGGGAAVLLPKRVGITSHAA